MAEGLLGIATSGLLTFQNHLKTTSNNIANVNTEGYSRQRVLSAARPSQLSSAGFLGKGVDAVDVQRFHNEFLSNQVRTSTSAHSELGAYHTLAAQIDNFIAERSTSLTPAMQEFFKSVNEVADDPTSIPARQVMKTNADTLADRFVTMNERLNRLQSQVNSNVGSVISEINSLADSLAVVNNQIVAALGSSGDRTPNDLLDQRDQLLNKLAEKVDVSTVEQQDGSLSVFIGSGQPLVLGAQAGTLTTQNSTSNPGEFDILFTTQTSSVIITKNISGGELTGTLRFRDEVLDPAQKALGRIAAGLAIDFNKVHSGGYDLNGITNRAFFNAPQVSVQGSFTNTGTITADFDDVNALLLSDYRVNFDGTDYTVTRLSDNSQIYNNASPNFVIDGLRIDANGAASGDSFIIQPTQNIAGQIAVAISSPSEIAASLSDTSSGNDAVGDNRNALALAGLDTQQNLLNGTATLQDAYGKVVAEVGTLTQAAEINKQAQQGLLNQARESREQVQGVNLDEEAANLIRYQQAYQASAQLVSVTRDIFESLLNAVRR